MSVAAKQTDHSVIRVHKVQRRVSRLFAQRKKIVGKGYVA